MCPLRRGHRPPSPTDGHGQRYRSSTFPGSDDEGHADESASGQRAEEARRVRVEEVSELAWEIPVRGTFTLCILCTSRVATDVICGLGVAGGYLVSAVVLTESTARAVKAASQPRITAIALTGTLPVPMTSEPIRATW